MSNANVKTVTNAPEMSPAEKELRAQLEKLQAELKQVKEQAAAAGPRLSLKVGEKGGVSLYGMGRFPVTLYAEQWESLLTEANVKFIRDFIASKPAGMTTKADKLAKEAAIKAAEAKARVEASGLKPTGDGQNTYKSGDGQTSHKAV